ncbi:MAG: uroporphyrinogen decarboxylase [Candidatus Zixiibacteriota bacterium]
MDISNSPFLKACRGENDGPIPVWIMRQAGRYLPDYRAVRERVSFLELCRTPELIAEVVRQPVERFGLDAAILFSDILTIVEPMGIPVVFPDGGPQLQKTIKNPADVAELRRFDVNKELWFVPEGIRRIKLALPSTPVIGFAGSPFTLACYLINGKGSHSFDKAKQFLHRYPDASEELMTLLVDVTVDYLRAQIDAGADAVQIFDSWGGILSKDDYCNWSARPINKIFRELKRPGTPRILFVNNLAPYIDVVQDIECEVVGVDYRMDLSEAASALSGKAIQGNLDPAVLFGTPERVVQHTEEILDSLDCHERLVFNLGHGILPETPLASVEALVQTVHNYRRPT